MNFLNDIIYNIQHSTSPETYYIVLAVALVAVFYIVNKILKTLMFFIIVGILVFGFSTMQGKDANTVIASISTYVGNIFADGGIRKSLTDMLSNLTDGKVNVDGTKPTTP